MAAFAKTHRARAISQILSWSIIYLSCLPVRQIKDPATDRRRLPKEARTAWHCNAWGLPPDDCYQRRRALLPHDFTLTPRGGIVSVALSVA